LNKKSLKHSWKGREAEKRNHRETTEKKKGEGKKENFFLLPP